MLKWRFLLGRLLVAATVFVLIGCNKVDHVMQSHYRLETASELISRQQFISAMDLLEQLLADVKREKDDFALQRFYACYLLTQANVLLGVQEQNEPWPETLQTRRLNPRIMTAMFYLGTALELLDAAKESDDVSASGKRLIPGRLAELSVEEAKNNLSLLVTGLYGGLRFGDKMQVSLDRFARIESLVKLEDAKQVFDETRTLDEVRPWVELAMSRYLRRSNGLEAYRFAMHSLHDENCPFDPLTKEELVNWINRGSDFRFKCNRCDQTVVPERAKCFNCGEPYLTAYQVNRETAP